MSDSENTCTITLEKGVVSPVPIFVAGNSKNFLKNWKEITSDKFILETISGVKLEFDNHPVLGVWPREYKFDGTLKKVVDAEILQLLEKGVVVPQEYEKEIFISNIFLRPKPNGKFRMILDLSLLNEDVHKRHFKMQHLEVAIDMLQRGDFMASIDLKDAYYTIPIHPEHQKFLCFSWRGELYRFRALPFGLSSAPRLFTKTLVPIFSTFREEGYMGFGYIDDSFIVDSSEMKCAQGARFLANLFGDLGFVVHPDKSQFAPSKTLVFLGYILDSEKMTVSPTQEKRDKAKGKIQRVLELTRVKIRELASLLGLLNDMCKGVDYGKSHLKNLEIDKIKALRKAGRKQFEGFMKLRALSKRDLIWWLDNVAWRSRLIRSTTPELSLTTDASLEGWGAVTRSDKAGGRWNPEEGTWHINALEVRGILFGLQTFFREASHTHIQVFCDNTTAVAYVNHGGSTRSARCNEQAREIWDFCEKRDIWLSVAHIPGVENVDADHESRQFTENTEWELNPEIFEMICDKWGSPDVDLFASRLNNKVESYASWIPDPGASFVDAFSVNWSQFNLCYIFPPFRLVNRCVRKVRDEGARAIVIAPAWPGQPWYSVLKERGNYTLRLPPAAGNLQQNHTRRGRDLSPPCQLASTALLVTVFYSDKLKV